MSPQRWQQINQLFEQALTLPLEQRADFLARACNGDDALRHEVLTLLAADADPNALIEQPLSAVAADLWSDSPSTLPLPAALSGTQLGAYKILRELGRGGMGEVYLAQDQKLGRRVALKLLPTRFTHDPERLHRFRQEARAASALNHPNIVMIFDIGEQDGQHFMATEYVEGQTLRAALQHTRFTLAQALDIVIQVGSALDAAHAAGIIHRDIKPENLMLRPDGYVKVLDFGLAKLTELSSTNSGEVSEGETRGSDLQLSFETRSGIVLGTVDYMSPEQARGQKVDARTDIFSLGVVLYELLMGERPFAGPTRSHVLVAILDQEPPPLAAHWPLVAHRTDAPAALQNLVSQMLRKDRVERYQHVKDLLLDLKDLKQELEFAAKLKGAPPFTSPSTDRATNTQPANAATDEAAAHTTSSAGIILGEIKRHKLGVGVALALFIATVAGLGYGLYKLAGQKQTSSGPAGPAPRIVPFTSYPGTEHWPSFSPEGHSIAFAWDGEQGRNYDIYVKLISAGAPLQLTTNPAADTNPAWSPDGHYIAFIRTTKDEGGIFLVPALGGQERKLCALTTTSASAFKHLAWFPDGKSLAFSEKSSPNEPYSIWSLSVTSLEKRKLTSPPVHDLGDHRHALSPDGKLLAFTRFTSSNTADLYLVPSAGGEPRRLTYDHRDLGGLAWTQDGRAIVFAAGQVENLSLWRIAIASGPPERVAAVGDNVYELAIPRSGTHLAYVQYKFDMNVWRLALSAVAGRTNAPTKLLASTLRDESPQYSADGQRIAFTSDRSGSLEIWTCDSQGANAVPVTSLGGAGVGSPRWSPDGRQIAFDCTADGDRNIYVISASGGTPRQLTKGAASNGRPSWSRDGKWVYFGSNRTGIWQVWKAPAEGGAAVQLTQQGGREAFESPDGKYLYYGKAPGLTSLWRMPVAGGAETQILAQVLQGRWALAEQGVYFLNPQVTPQRTIEFFSFASARTTQIAIIEKELSSATALAVSPDGKWLLLAQNDRTESDILLLENFR